MPWPTGKPRSLEDRAAISAKLKGRPRLDLRAKAPWNKNTTETRPEVHARLITSHTKPEGSELSYTAAHGRARKVLPPACALADASCRGRLEAAFRHDAPVKFVRLNDRGHPYYIGPHPLEGYWRLCNSHHTRYDNA